MTRYWRRCSWKWVSASLFMVGGAIASSRDCAIAQIAPDGTLPNNSAVTPQGNTSVINGGTQAGSNLFHSFEQFSVPTKGAAYFNNALDIQNIISRVTGSEISNIDGLLRANGTANLFLLNPNGIIFGPNASLNIGGSFVGSTASAVNFADGTQFSATVPQNTPLLSVSVPIGLQYGGTTPGGIQVQRSGLQVQTGQTLALVGGSVSVEGGELGFLQALGGRIELGGLAGAGTVDIEGQQSFGAFRLTSLRFPDAVERADVLLTNLAYVNVAALGGGSIAVNARNLDVSGGSSLLAGIKTGLGSVDSQAGDITLNATKAITVNDSLIFNNVRPGAVGNAGEVNIKTGSLFVTNGAQLTAATLGKGDAGSVTIHALDAVSFDGSDAFSSVEEEAVGKGGDINITTGSLFVTNGAQLAAGTQGQGDAGSVFVQADESVSLAGNNTTIFSSVEEGAFGNGGDINITTRSLSVTNGAQLGSATEGQGPAGSVTINARDTVSFDGVGSNGNSSAALSNVQPSGVGRGGDINITAESLSLTGGAQLVGATQGQGNAGSLTIEARDTIFFDGSGSNGIRSGLFNIVVNGAVGNGGDINVKTGSLSVTNSAVLNASTYGQGDAGSVTIIARDTASFDGVSNGLYSATASMVGEGSVGNGGDINITTRSLALTNGALITASSEGNGAAGNIKVSASSIHLEARASLSSDTTAEQGNIDLDSQDLVLRRGSNITTNATGTSTGGNITIDTDILAALENSDISANAQNARGGQVIIDAQGIFGTEFRDRLTPESDITASSRLGPQFNGTVEINTPDVDPSAGLVALPAQVVNVPGLIATGCAALGENEFIITGRGGLPPSPSDPLRAEALLADWVTLGDRAGGAGEQGSREAEGQRGRGAEEKITYDFPPASRQLLQRGEPPQRTGSPASPAPSASPPQIVEAQGWVINNNGEVVLTATAPNATPHNPWMTPANCHTPSSSS